jgi:hypothetical protein
MSKGFGSIMDLVEEDHQDHPPAHLLEEHLVATTNP